MIKYELKLTVGRFSTTATMKIEKSPNTLEEYLDVIDGIACNIDKALTRVEDMIMDSMGGENDD